MIKRYLFFAITIIMFFTACSNIGRFSKHSDVEFGEVDVLRAEEELNEYKCELDNNVKNIEYMKPIFKKTAGYRKHYYFNTGEEYITIENINTDDVRQIKRYRMGQEEGFLILKGSSLYKLFCIKKEVYLDYHDYFSSYSFEHVAENVQEIVISDNQYCNDFFGILTNDQEMLIWGQAPKLEELQDNNIFSEDVTKVYSGEKVLSHVSKAWVMEGCFIYVQNDVLKVIDYSCDKKEKVIYRNAKEIISLSWFCDVDGYSYISFVKTDGSIKLWSSNESKVKKLNMKEPVCKVVNATEELYILDQKGCVYYVDLLKDILPVKVATDVADICKSECNKVIMLSRANTVFNIEITKSKNGRIKGKSFVLEDGINFIDSGALINTESQIMVNQIKCTLDGVDDSIENKYVHCCVDEDSIFADTVLLNKEVDFVNSYATTTASYYKSKNSYYKQYPGKEPEFMYEQDEKEDRCIYADKNTYVFLDKNKNLWYRNSGDVLQYHFAYKRNGRKCDGKSYVIEKNVDDVWFDEEGIAFTKNNKLYAYGKLEYIRNNLLSDDDWYDVPEYEELPPYLPYPPHLVEYEGIKANDVQKVWFYDFKIYILLKNGKVYEVKPKQKLKNGYYEKKREVSESNVIYKNEVKKISREVICYGNGVAKIGEEKDVKTLFGVRDALCNAGTYLVLRKTAMYLCGEKTGIMLLMDLRISIFRLKIRR